MPDGFTVNQLPLKIENDPNLLDKFSLNHADEHFAGGTAEAGGWKFYRCERRKDHAGIRQVIETDNRDISWHRDSFQCQSLNDVTFRVRMLIRRSTNLQRRT